MERERKLVYVPMAADTIHPGHLNIIKIAAQLGEVMVGLFTDEAIASYKRVPVMNYEQRKTVIESIKGVDVVVKQETRDYEPNLRKYQPDYMVHGTDWREGPLAAVREKAIHVLAEWGGSIVEPEYTKGVSSSEVHSKEEKNGFTSQQKMNNLKKLLQTKKNSKMIGVYNEQGALIAENLEVKSKDGVKQKFDAIWIDKEGIARGKGEKTKESLDMSEYFEVISGVCRVSNKPVIVEYSQQDGDADKFLRKAEQAGVSAIVICENDQRKKKELVSFFKDARKFQELLIFVESDSKQETEACVDMAADGLMLTYDDMETVRNYAGKMLMLLSAENIVSDADDQVKIGIVYKDYLSRTIEQTLRESMREVLA